MKMNSVSFRTPAFSTAPTISPTASSIAASIPAYVRRGSGRPAYVCLYFSGTWCGAWTALNGTYRKNGLLPAVSATNAAASFAIRWVL